MERIIHTHIRPRKRWLVEDGPANELARRTSNCQVGISADLSSHADVTGKLGVKYLPVTFHPVTYLSFNTNATFLLLFNYDRVSMLYYWPHHVNE